MTAAAPVSTARFATLARTLGLAPREALLLALRRARRPGADWHLLLADSRRLRATAAGNLFATAIAEYAQGETDNALALLLARART